MTTRKRNEAAFLALLVVVIAAILLYENSGSPQQTADTSPDIQYQPISLENPSLRLDLLARLHTTEYTGRHRNIFSEAPPPPPPPSASELAKAQRRPTGPQLPPPPPPLVVDVKFYGYVDDRASGKRRAFFTNGDDVFIAAQGDTLEGRYRVARIGNDSADLEEISSGRRTTLAMEQPPEQAQVPPEPQGPQGPQK
jgi:hypothetical protein